MRKGFGFGLPIQKLQTFLFGASRVNFLILPPFQTFFLNMDKAKVIELFQQLQDHGKVFIAALTLERNSVNEIMALGTVSVPKKQTVWN